MATYDDGKDAGAMRTIGEVAQATGIKAHVLRYWEQQFPMLKPLKRSGGRRLYRPEDVALVEAIDRLVNHEGYTLKGAKAALKGGSQASTESVPITTTNEFSGRASAAPADILPRLKAIREELRRALTA